MCNQPFYYKNFKGDSGGPLSHVHDDGVFEQIGVVSFGSIQGCEVKLPAGLSSTQYFLPWISAITGILV
jgi:secreted trypsin-like serine protease